MIKENLYNEITDKDSTKTENTPAPPEPSYIYVWKLKKMKVSHQYDSWLAGGSEFDFQVAYPEIDGYVAMVKKFRITFSRTDIKKCREKNFDVILNTNWRPEPITNGIYISESDPGGSEKTYTTSLSYNDKITGITNSVSASFKYKSHDDFVFQSPFDRNFILYNKDNYMNLDGGVSLVMPIEINTLY